MPECYGQVVKLSTIPNESFYKIFRHEGTKTVNVTLTGVMDGGVDDEITLRNMRNAIDLYLATGGWPAWLEKITVE